MWVLVLTMLSTAHYDQNAVASVPGFKSEAACMAAADAWLKQVAQANAHLIDGAYKANRALCARQD